MFGFNLSVLVAGSAALLVVLVWGKTFSAILCPELYF
jgi:hypothetical protein